MKIIFGMYKYLVEKLGREPHPSNLWAKYATSSEVVRECFHWALLQIFDLQGGQCLAFKIPGIY